MERRHSHRRDGQATVESGLNDAVTSFRVFGDAFGDSGALGGASLAIESVEPFYLEPKLPQEVTSGDLIRLPLGIVNATNSQLEDATLHPQCSVPAIDDSKTKPFALPANARVRHYLDLQIGNQVGEARLQLDAKAGPYADKVTRTFMVRPLGFPTVTAFGGLLGEAEPCRRTSSSLLRSCPAVLKRGSSFTRRRWQA